MKKLVTIVCLALVAVLAFAACGAPAPAASEAAPAASEEAAPAVSEEAPAVSEEAAAPAGGAITIAMLPKFKGENYFDACKTGAEEAVAELTDSGVEVTFLYDGPPQDQATNQKQVDILEGWIAQGVNVIIVSPNDPEAIAPTLQKAMGEGIKVLTYDADANPDARDLFVNQVTAEGTAKSMVAAVAQTMEAKGYGPENPINLGIVSSAKTDANQAAWLDGIKSLIASDDYNWMKIANEETDVYYPGPDETKAQQDAATLVSRMGEGEDKIQAAIGLSSMATPALGAAYESAAEKPDATKITMTGLATPNALKEYILNPENPLDTGILWDCMDLGYLAVMAGYQMGTGVITPESTSMTTTRLGDREIADKMVVLGDALIFDSSNVENYNY